MMSTNAVRDFYEISEPKVKVPRVAINSLKGIFISHFHADHVGGLPMLLQSIHFCQKRRYIQEFEPENRLRLFLPPKTIRLFQNLLDALTLTKLSYKLEISPIEEGEFYSDEHARVSAVRNSHIKEGGSYSFILDAEGRRIVYSGDLRDACELLPLIREGADLLITECNHFKPESLFGCLRAEQDGLRKLLITHIHSDFYGREEELATLGQKYLKCEITVSHDNMEISL